MYNLRSSKQMEPEVPSPPLELTVDAGNNGDVMESGPQHRALCNEYILAELFSHLSVEDLKECRLVNQVWNQVATRVLAPKAPVLEFTDKAGIQRMAIMEKFMDTFRSIDNPPYRKFKVGTGILYKASQEKQLVLPKFIEKVAPSVTHLGVSSIYERLFPWKKPKKGTAYPKLKSVELFTTTLKSNEAFMISILQHAPNLDSIAFLDVIRHKCADRLIENVPWTMIRQLKLDGELEDDHFQKLSELGTAMKLKSFEMEASEFRGEATFTKFLDSQSSSLEALKFRFVFWFPQPPSALRLPRFPELKTLEVNFSDLNKAASEDMYRLLSLPSFSQWFPALNSVTVTEIRWSGLYRFLRSEDSAPVDTVEILKFDLSSEYVYNYNVEQANIQRVVRHLGQMFPRVRKLHAPAIIDVMKVIDMAHAWKDLVDLTLICGKSRNVDTALIGQPPEEYLGISDLSPRSRTFQQEERRIESNSFNFLQNIETLEMELDYTDFGVNVSDRRVTCFTDMSCRLVLLKMRNLKCLNLCGLGNHGGTSYQITKPMILEMSAKFRVLYEKRKSQAE